ncbi:Histidinol dehydrogenase [hydrothermal vent metagenome]|uniref:histidinol dehydrogenase n=1 Tax=hydrothermal vent metagenome TaxID=652676 RepID=A0A3B0TY08_9ZZZZ
MVFRLNSATADFPAGFAAFLATKRGASADAAAAVAEIINNVRAAGDEALIAYTSRFDRLELTPDRLRIGADEWAGKIAECPADVVEALEFAHKRIVAFHQRQKPQDVHFTDAMGVELGTRWSAVDAAGLYVPGGTAAYPSSVLMNAVPAKVAGVGRLAMVVPAPDGGLNAGVLAAARIAGVDEIYRVGGAQAVAALAYGTATIAPVDVIVGPGNAYVAEAKRQVFGQVGIDMVAGPSEVLIIADRQNDPAWIAADLLAQAEHDVEAQSILITDDADFADAVETALEGQMKTLPRGAIAERSWTDFGAVILVADLGEAVALIDRIAPEHLEIATAEPDAIAASVKHAGAIFIGRHTPEAVGDYVAGTNHVLPTGRSARFSSGLGVLDFMKRTSLLKCSPAALRHLAPAAVTLGHAEGLDAHSRSVAIRLNLASKE